MLRIEIPENPDTEHVEVKSRESSFQMKANHVNRDLIRSRSKSRANLLVCDQRSRTTRIRSGDDLSVRSAEAIGGPMTNGRMSDAYSGKLELRQGQRHITLAFEEGRVIEKSAQGSGIGDTLIRAR